MHFLPNKKVLYQSGSWETECKQSLDIEDEYSEVWKVQKNKEGVLYLRVAEDPEDFEGRYTSDFKILHLSKTRMVVEGNTYPDHDTTKKSIMQFERVDYIQK